MKQFVFILMFFWVQGLFAADKIKMNFVNEDLPLIIEHYSKESGTKFIIDSTVRGKITLLNNEKVTLEEAYNQLSEALAINGFAIVKRDDYSVIRNARSAQRDGIEVYINEVPGLRPQRMATWIVNLKYVSAKDLLQNSGRLINSSYGEMSVNQEKNQLIITDFTSSLNKVAKMLQEMDKPGASRVLIEQRRLDMKSKGLPLQKQQEKPIDAQAQDDKVLDVKKIDSEDK